MNWSDDNEPTDPEVLEKSRCLGIAANLSAAVLLLGLGVRSAETPILFLLNGVIAAVNLYLALRHGVALVKLLQGRA